MNARKGLGQAGEEKAANYLAKNGYKIVERNYRCRLGELDIIAVKDKSLVVVEVKTRRSFSFGRPCESITALKKKHILRTASLYVTCNSLEDMDIRIDVIEVLYHGDGCYINHIENAF